MVPKDIKDLPLKQWNKGVFDHELVKTKLVDGKGKQLQQGTYAGTELAITEIYARIERW